MMKNKHIRIVQYTIFVYEDDAMDLEHTISDVLQKSSVLNFVCTGERWS